VTALKPEFSDKSGRDLRNSSPSLDNESKKYTIYPSGNYVKVTSQAVTD